MNNFERGAEWRRWDLHLHTPFTKLSNGYKLDDKSDEKIWEKYISILEESSVQVFGITDYFSCDNYFTLIEKYKQKHPKTEKVFFPNIELRLSETISKENTNPDLHIIFDNDATKCSQSILKKFLSKLETIAADENGVRIACSDLKTRAQFEAASVAFRDVQKALNDTFGTAKPYLLVFPANNDGIRSTDSNSPRKVSSSNEIDKASDLFFGNSGNRQYLLRDDRYYPGQTRSKPKPVVSGSDAHSFADMERLEGNTKGFEPTWIKADLTFRGLKQICYEPEARVFIGGEPEVHTRKSSEATKFLEKLCVDQLPDYDESNGIWFKNTEIPLNPELVVIIGNKGSGKSSLVDIIGLLANSRQHKYFSFLVDDSKNKKFRQRGYAENFKAQLYWGNEKVTEQKLDAEIDYTVPEAVRYLPQNYFEQLTNEIEIQDFRKEIEEVVFSHVNFTDKMGKASFAELQEFKTQQSLIDTSALKGRLRELNFEIVKLEEQADPITRKKIAGRLKVKKEELEALDKAKPKEVQKPTSQTDEQKNLATQIAKLSESMEEVRKNGVNMLEDISQKKERLQKLISLLEKVIGIEADLKATKSELSLLCEELGYRFDDLISLKINNDRLKKEISELQSNIQLLEKDNQLTFTETPNIESLRSHTDLRVAYKYLSDARNVLKEQLGAPEKRYQIYVEKLRNWENEKSKIIGDADNPQSGTIKYLEVELSYIDNELSQKIADAIETRHNLSMQIFASKKKVLKFYTEIKTSVDAKLKSVRTDEFSVNIESSFVLKGDFYSQFFGFIQRNKRGSFHGVQESKQKLTSMLKEVNWNDFSSVENFQNNILSALNSSNGQRLAPKDQVTNIKEFYDFLFSMEFFEAKYELKLGDKTLNELSPGEKGLLLLIFYLQLDNNNIPLIIDQPEDNLDNDSIFAVLANCIREAKKHRQVILVTHNPNLAVGADAEQIIYVRLDKANNYEFSYETGSIENPEINKKIVKVLEGSQPAFVKRRLMYQIA